MASEWRSDAYEVRLRGCRVVRGRAGVETRERQSAERPVGGEERERRPVARALRACGCANLRAAGVTWCVCDLQPLYNCNTAALRVGKAVTRSNLLTVETAQ